MDELYSNKSSALLIHGECLAEMAKLDDQSVDMVMCDLPYGTTQNKWDAVIAFEPMWAQYRRICKGAIVLTASQPFSSALVMSNPKEFKHEWVWIKNRGSNFLNCVREPMKEHEVALVFATQKWTYNKQMQERTGGGVSMAGQVFNTENNTENYGKFKRSKTPLTTLRVPSSWQKFNTEVGLHPTQKPVALMEYLIKTYTNEGMTVLDNCMGSGTTGVACINTGRNFIGIEQDEKYFAIAEDRIQAAASQVTNS
jgi:site-specific DNA-methyltransferase (adenine-specific)